MALPRLLLLVLLTLPATVSVASQEALRLDRPSAQTRPARPSPARVFWSICAGAATALVPLAVGGTLAALGQDARAKTDAIYVIEAGLVAAPVVSHAVGGEYARGAVLGLPPFALALGMRELIALRPDIIDESTTEARVAFYALLSVSVLASAAGIIDSALGGERARRLYLAPAPARAGAGLVIGGVL